MKKIFAIVISLLFLASVFGVGAAMADNGPIEECDCDVIPCNDIFQLNRSTVRVGETITLSFTYELDSLESMPDPPRIEPFAEWIDSWRVPYITPEDVEDAVGYTLLSHYGTLARELIEEIYYEGNLVSAVRYSWTGLYESDQSEIIYHDEDFDSGQAGQYTFIQKHRAVRPGVVHFFLLGEYEDFTECYVLVPVTITQRSLPMYSILRILGISGLMRE